MEIVLIFKWDVIVHMSVVLFPELKKQLWWLFVHSEAEGLVTVYRAPGLVWLGRQAGWLCPQPGRVVGSGKAETMLSPRTAWCQHTKWGDEPLCVKTKPQLPVDPQQLSKTLLGQRWALLHFPIFWGDYGLLIQYWTVLRFYDKCSPKQREFYQLWVYHSADLDGFFWP